MAYVGRLGWLVVAFPLVVAACEEDKPTATITSEEACTNQAQAICERFERCTLPLGSTAAPADGGTSADAATADAGAGDLAADLGVEDAGLDSGATADAGAMGSWGIARNFADVAACVAVQKNNCLESLSRPNIAQTAALENTCADAIAAQSCPAWIAREVVLACNSVAGLLEDGEACVAGAQCQSRFCALPFDGTCGQCAPVPSEGTDCSNLTACGPELICHTTDEVLGTRQCVKPGESSESCGVNRPCARELVCVGDNARMGTLGSCQAPLTTLDAACNPASPLGADCSQRIGLYCNRAGNTCKIRQLAQVGEPCGTFPEPERTVVNCAAGFACVRPLDPITMQRPAIGACAADVAENEACFSAQADGPGCRPGLACIRSTPEALGGVCKKRDLASCTSNPAPDAGPEAGGADGAVDASDMDATAG